MSEFRKIQKDIKADIYFIVGVGSTQVKSLPKKYKDTLIGLEDFWIVNAEDEFYIVLYAKSKTVNSQPLATYKIPLLQLQHNKRLSNWYPLGNQMEIHLDYHFHYM